MTPSHSKGEGRGKGNGDSDSKRDSKGNGKGEGKDTGDGIEAAASVEHYCCCCFAILPSLPRRSPSAAMPILPLLQSSSSGKMGVAAGGQSSGAVEQQGWGCGCAWCVVDLCVYVRSWYGVQCRLDPTQNSCVGGIFVSAPTRILSSIWCCQHVADKPS